MMMDDIEKVLFTKEQLAAKVAELGKQISEEYAGQDIFAVCILKGAIVFFSDLIRELKLPLSIDFMAISSYGNSTKTSGVVRILKDLDHPVEDRDVLVVEDIVDSGLTLAYIKQTLEQRGARSVKLVTLLDKPERRKNGLQVDYACFHIPNEFVVGYGLDFAEKYRNVPDIGVLDPRIYT